MSKYVAVADTSVLISLRAAGMLEHLDQLFVRVHVPLEVRAEYLRVEERLFGSSSTGLTVLLERPPFQPCSEFDSISLAMLKEHLDPGEAEAIEQSRHVGASFVLLDERAGREQARRQGLDARGTARLIAQLAVTGYCDYWKTIKLVRRVARAIIPDSVAREAHRLARSGHW